MKTFGQRIKEARKEKGFTLDQVAKACRSHKGYISGIENAKTRPPSPKILVLLCKKLELDPEELAALAWWEKRPKGITVTSMSLLLAKFVEKEKLLPVETEPQKEAV